MITGARTGELGTGHHRSDYPIPDEIRGFPSYLRDQGYYTTNNAKTDYNTSDHERLIAESWHESSDGAGWWGREPDQPFFAVFNFMQSHQSWTMSLPYHRYASGVLDRLAPEDRTADDEIEMPPFLRDSPEMRRQLARVYNSLTLTDQQVGDILTRLSDDGLAEDTIIFLFADHGEGIPRAKTNGIGLGYRVPMIISVPERWQHLAPWSAGSVTDELVTFEDLPSTLISLAGVPAPAQLHGRSLLGPDRTPAPRYRHGSADRSDETTDLERAVFDGRFVYSRHFMPYLPELSWRRYHDIGDIRVQMREDHAAGVLTPAQRLFAIRSATSSLRRCYPAIETTRPWRPNGNCSTIPIRWCVIGPRSACVARPPTHSALSSTT